MVWSWSRGAGWFFEIASWNKIAKRTSCLALCVGAWEMAFSDRRYTFASFSRIIFRRRSVRRCFWTQLHNTSYIVTQVENISNPASARDSCFSFINPFYHLGFHLELHLHQSFFHSSIYFPSSYRFIIQPLINAESYVFRCLDRVLSATRERTILGFEPYTGACIMGTHCSTAPYG